MARKRIGGGMSGRRAPAREGSAGKGAPLPDFVGAEAFLNWDPGRWWQFKEISTNTQSRWECAQLAPDRLQLRATLGARVVLHTVAAKEAGPLTQYIVLRSQVDDLTITWAGGLVMPAPWRVGQMTSARSDKGANPATGNPVEMRITLVKHDEAFKPPADMPFFPSGRLLRVIQLQQVVADVSLGTILFTSTQLYALGLGIFSVGGQNFGIPYKLVLEDTGPRL